MSECYWEKTGYHEEDSPKKASYVVKGGTLSIKQRGEVSFFQSRESEKFFANEFGPLCAVTEEQAKKEVFQILEARTRNEHLALGYAARDLGY